MANEYYNIPVVETEHFKVLPSLGSIIEGWLLIIPKSHYLNFGQIFGTELHNELNDLIFKICSQVRLEYGNYIIFEHGPIAESTTVGCGVDHAHIHIVPISLSLQEVIVNSPHVVNWQEVMNLEAVAKYSNSRKQYLYFQDSFSKSFVAVNELIESQFFRRVIANVVGKPEVFNWNDYHFLENVEKTYKKFSPYSKRVQYQTLL